jgi:DNA-binding NarL/FixJ family response regulator/tetratricopeptide (TPR) repeat protein
VEHRAGTERVRETVRTGPWRHVYEDLSGRDPVRLAPVELDALAEAAWWLCKTDESIAARQQAYAGFRDAGDDRGAARTAARLFHEHFYRGEGAVAVGWLRRGFRHVEQDPDGIEGGWLRMAEAELHLHQGPLEQAVDGAAHAIQTAQHHGDADLAAVAMQIQGRALIAQGRIDEGLALLDDAMTCVLAGELAPLYTGWVYCSVILACKDLADLQRASEWTEAARVWCEALPATTPYSQGLCRIYRGEVLALHGAWAEAEAELRRAHQQLLLHKPQGAAEASYGVGEVLRRRGDLGGAEQAFVRAQQLGWDPQPGMALVRLAQGRVEAAAAALRSALASPTVDRFGRARLLAAQVEVTIAAGALDDAGHAAGELVAIADGLGSAVVQATASMAQGALQLASGSPAVALEQLRGALRGWRELQLPYEEATARLLIGATQRMLGDEEGGRIEVDAARAGFDRLGAAVDARHAAALLRPRASQRLLTDREVQVLRLVAAGKHNRDIAAALHLSEHTVARHMQNILAKLGVSSRAAATSAALKQGLL